MKKYLFLVVIVLIAVAVFFFARSQRKNIYVGVVWVGHSDIADARYEGLTKAIQKLTPQIKFSVRKEVGSQRRLTRIIRFWEKNKDAIILVRSKTVSWLANHDTTIPTFITLCNDPSYLGVLKNLDRPERNITGTTYIVPVYQQLRFFKSLLPKMDSILFLHEAGHPSHMIDKRDVYKACKQLNIQLYDVPCNTKRDLLNAVKKYHDKVDAIVIGNHALGYNNSSSIVENAGNLPVFSFLYQPIAKTGVLAVYSAHSDKMNDMLAQSVVDVLINHKPIQDIPIKMDKNPKGIINMTAAKRLGIDIPATVLLTATEVNE